MPSLSDLITPATSSALLERLIMLLRLARFPTRAWQTFSFLRWTIESEAEVLADLGETVAAIARGGFLRHAERDWLTLLAADVYSVTRKPAAFAIHDVELRDVASVGPEALTAGTVWVGTADRKLRFVVAEFPDGNVIPLNGALRVRVRAERAGADYNVAPGAISEMVTSLPGISVDNPPIDETSSSLVAQGAEEEGDPSLRERCSARWALLGTGATEAAYRSWCLAADDEVRRVVVQSPGGGAVRIVVAGATAPLSAGALANVRSVVAQRRPLGVPDVTADNATAAPIPIAATLYLEALVDAPTVLAAARAAVATYLASLPIGARVSRERIIAALAVPGVVDMDVPSPSADVTLPADGLAVATFALTVGLR